MLEALALRKEIPFQFLGETGGDQLVINGSISIHLVELAEIYYDAIPKRMDN